MSTVLFISADDKARLLLTTIVECVGHTVSMAGSLPEGIECLRRELANVVLLTVSSPQSALLEGIAQLRAVSPLVKILVLVEKDDVVDFLAVRMMGADDVLRQPLGSKALLDAVNQTLREDLI
jgi:DNA-binding response OmpR family regulator